MSPMLTLTRANEAKKALLALQAKQFKQVAVSVLNLLSDPYPHDSESMKGASRGERGGWTSVSIASSTR